MLYLTQYTMADTEKRMLKIKTGSVVRLNKELGLYETEKEAEAKRVAKMREEGADPYDIKHAVGFHISTDRSFLAHKSVCRGFSFMLSSTRVIISVCL